MPRPPRIACIGEAMIEFSQLDLGLGKARVGFAGDTLNTAIYLSRLMPGTVSYVTNLGQDGLSDKMLNVLATEGIDTSLIGRHPTRLPGIYVVETDPTGERSFQYWRNTSAARTLFAGTGATLQDLDQFDVIFLSGITLAILDPDIRSQLTARLAALRDAGCLVIFDSNYRPRLWPDPVTARDAIAAMWTACSMALPSFDDECLLFAGTDPARVLTRISRLGVPEIILKNGGNSIHIWHQSQSQGLDLPAAAKVVDTTGAGDSFNAGYIAARLTGAAPVQAAAAGHRLAVSVIGHHGAVMAPADMPAVVSRQQIF